MEQSFNMPSAYQTEANMLPSQVPRYQQVFAGGQNQDVLTPWQRQAAGLKSRYGAAPISATEAGKYRGYGYFTPSAHDPVGNLIQGSNAEANGFGPRMAASQQLVLNGLRRSGSLGSVRSVRLGVADPLPDAAVESAASADAAVGEFVTAPVDLEISRPWYRTPWAIVGGAAALALGGYYFFK